MEYGFKTNLEMDSMQQDKDETYEFYYESRK